MRTVSVVASLAAGLAVGLSAMQGGKARTFDLETPQLPPAGFVFGAMRQPGSGRWLVDREGTNGVVTHVADPAAQGYALALATEAVGADLDVSVRLRFTGPNRTAGLVWRAIDDQNFHALVLDLGANTLSVYRVASGNRIRLDLADDLELDPLAWHTLKVTHDDDEIRVSLGGIGVFRERDRRDRAPGQPLRAGLLAGGTTDVRFDDLRIEPDRGRR